jgi:hypothetical protein
MVDDLRVAEGGEIGGLVISGNGGEEADGSGDDAGDQQLVVLSGLSTGGVRVDADVRSV